MNSSDTHIASGDPVVTGFEHLYIQLRQKEGRVYKDEEVEALPIINKEHRHYKEWIIRKNSCRALLNYVKQRNHFLSILEVGCGNGWLSAQLATAKAIKVTGLDINSKELEQAERVFENKTNLKFIKGSLQSELPKDEKFDMIVFAASIQYFPSLKQIVTLAVERLTLLGEIHIMDSPFYQQHEMEAARQRTKEYYSGLGFPQMTGCYYHHTINELDTFQYKIIHHPHSWKNKLTIKKNPFYWISIKNRYS